MPSKTRLGYTITTIGHVDISDRSTSIAIKVPKDELPAGVHLALDEGCRDWRKMQALAWDMRSSVALRFKLTIHHAAGHWTLFFVPRPGVKSRVVVTFDKLQERPPNTSCPGYFHFGGGPNPVDLSSVTAIEIQYDQFGPARSLRIGDLSLLARPSAPQVWVKRPVVDEFGQWTGRQGKPRSAEEIREYWQQEPSPLKRCRGQTALGGDPSVALEATAFFRVAKENGRWWLVDPRGNPFFSIGCNCVNPHASGPVQDRHHLFKQLPPIQVGRRGVEEADFYNANLRRRYGEDWHSAWSQRTVARLRHWGFNTIANWSDPNLTSQGLMPYCTNLGSLGPLCGHLPDVYAPDFEAQVERLVAPEVTPHVNDRMLIGYFVGNEPVWTFGGHRHPFRDVLTTDEYPHTRTRAIEWLRQRYEDNLSALNAAWGISAPTWEEVAAATPDPRTGTEALRADADEFIGQVLDSFYSTCCRVIKRLDPNHLTLGGRFYTPHMSEPFLRACAAFDVFSFNCYDYQVPADQVAHIEELTGRPSMVGEFHFGVCERGLSPSLVATGSQKERGEAYAWYVRSALVCPAMVGAHWFQWVDEPVTGRFDGEEYNIGLVDVTDVPYDRMLARAAALHRQMYHLAKGER